MSTHQSMLQHAEKNSTLRVMEYSQERRDSDIFTPLAVRSQLSVESTVPALMKLDSMRFFETRVTQTMSHPIEFVAVEEYTVAGNRTSSHVENSARVARASLQKGWEFGRQNLDKDEDGETAPRRDARCTFMSE